MYGKKLWLVFSMTRFCSKSVIERVSCACKQKILSPGYGIFATFHVFWKEVQLEEEDLGVQLRINDSECTVYIKLRKEWCRASGC